MSAYWGEGGIVGAPNSVSQAGLSKQPFLNIFMPQSKFLH